MDSVITTEGRRFIRPCVEFKENGSCDVYWQESDNVQFSTVRKNRKFTTFKILIILFALLLTSCEDISKYDISGEIIQIDQCTYIECAVKVKTILRNEYWIARVPVMVGQTIYLHCRETGDCSVARTKIKRGYERVASQ